MTTQNIDLSMGYLDFWAAIRGMSLGSKERHKILLVTNLIFERFIVQVFRFFINFLTLFAISFQEYCIWEPNTGQKWPKYPRKGRIRPFAVNTGPVISSGFITVQFIMLLFFSVEFHIENNSKKSVPSPKMSYKLQQPMNATIQWCVTFYELYTFVVNMLMHDIS